MFLLPFEGTVGSYARHNEIKQIGEIADQYGDGQIIVLLVDSPGGLVKEGDDIRATLLDLQKRHTLVAWIHKAISAGRSPRSTAHRSCSPTPEPLDRSRCSGATRRLKAHDSRLDQGSR